MAGEGKIQGPFKSHHRVLVGYCYAYFITQHKTDMVHLQISHQQEALTDGMVGKHRLGHMLFARQSMCLNLPEEMPCRADERDVQLVSPRGGALCWAQQFTLESRLPTGQRLQAQK